jgi:hypothetical protein
MKEFDNIDDYCPWLDDNNFICCADAGYKPEHSFYLSTKEYKMKHIAPFKFCPWCGREIS